jgi:hypothetical protein
MGIRVRTVSSCRLSGSTKRKSDPNPRAREPDVDGAHRAVGGPNVDHSDGAHRAAVRRGPLACRICGGARDGHRRLVGGDCAPVPIFYVGRSRDCRSHSRFYVAEAIATPIQLNSASCAIISVTTSGVVNIISTTKRIVYSVFGKHSAPAPVSPMPDLVASPVACDRASAQSPNTSTSRAQLNACSPSVQGRPSIVEEGEYCTS